jgi:hypothetical protein
MFDRFADRLFDALGWLPPCALTQGHRGARRRMPRPTPRAIT